MRDKLGRFTIGSPGGPGRPTKAEAKRRKAEKERARQSKLNKLILGELEISSLDDLLMVTCPKCGHKFKGW